MLIDSRELKMASKKELNRLIKYSEGLGLTIEFRPDTKESPSEYGGFYDDSDKKITIFLEKKTTIKRQILTLLHEIGHHLDFIYKNKKEPMYVTTAYHAEVWRIDRKKKLPRTLREIIYNCEKDGIKYMS
jgi:Zn-dependent peptidase ImmA (M78 family)